MTPWWSRPAPVVVGLAFVVLLTACAAGTTDADTGPDDDAVPTAAAVVAPAPCPALEPAEPRADGLPDLELPCLGDGPAVRLSDLRGVPTVLNVWAAWCPNCVEEMPLFAKAMERAGEDVRFLGVHYKATNEQAAQSVGDFGVPFPSVQDEDGDRVALELGVRGPPQTFFVAADGRVVGRKIGPLDSQRELDELIARHLGVEL